MNIVTLLPFIVLIGAMFLMTRSAKKKQQQAAQMRDQMQPGTGVRTIGGMYATVMEVRDDAVLLEVAEDIHVLFAKNAVNAVLEPEEYDRIVQGSANDLELDDAPVVPDDASELTEAGDEDDERIDLGKKADSAADDEPVDDADDAVDQESVDEESEDEAASARGKGGKGKGDSEAK